MELSYSLDVLQITRQNVIALLDAHTPEQLNMVPPGFNNNLIWNAGHIVATQQLLCYGLSGVPLRVAKSLVESYRKGTRPGDPVDAACIADIRALLASTADQLEADYRAGLFGSFKAPYTTSYGTTLHDVTDSITFNNVHEGMHYGVMLALRKLV
jgi:hypothetical protein